MKLVFGREEIIDFVSSADNTLQQARLFRSRKKGKQPLVVGLHTWSADMYQNCSNYNEAADLYDFHFVFPNFRGPNWRPQGCGSEYMVRDIESLVKHLCKIMEVDKDRIYLIGGSGGGHATLLLAGRLPHIWAGASAWVPISDVKAWHDQCLPGPCRGYSMHIRSACGGDPEINPDAAKEMVKRSPIVYLAKAAKIPLDINTGIHDGHRGSVPVSQSLNAFNILAAPKDRISEKDIKYMVEKEGIPASLAKEKTDDPAYGALKVLFRRISGNVRITVFEGGHDSAPTAGMGFLAKQKKGVKADWSLVDGKVMVSVGVVAK